jgi:hypothetical protein
VNFASLSTLLTSLIPKASPTKPGVDTRERRYDERPTFSGANHRL